MDERGLRQKILDPPGLTMMDLADISNGYQPGSSRSLLWLEQMTDREPRLNRLAWECEWNETSLSEDFEHITKKFNELFLEDEINPPTKWERATHRGIFPKFPNVV